jgi:hypothetical protein
MVAMKKKKPALSRRPSLAECGDCQWIMRSATGGKNLSVYTSSGFGGLAMP